MVRCARVEVVSGKNFSWVMRSKLPVKTLDQATQIEAGQQISAHFTPRDGRTWVVVHSLVMYSSSGGSIGRQINRLSKLNSDQQASTHWEPIRKEAPDSCYFPQQVDKYAPGSWSTHWLCIAALVAALVDKSIG